MALLHYIALVAVYNIEICLKQLRTHDTIPYALDR
jgi:hypothetical protein